MNVPCWLPLVALAAWTLLSCRGPSQTMTENAVESDSSRSAAQPARPRPPQPPGLPLSTKIDIARSCKEVRITFTNEDTRPAAAGVLAPVQIRDDKSKLVIDQDLEAFESIASGQSKSFNLAIRGYTQKLTVTVAPGRAKGAEASEPCPSIM